MMQASDQDRPLHSGGTVYGAGQEHGLHHGPAAAKDIQYPRLRLEQTAAVLSTLLSLLRQLHERAKSKSS
jgi:hypothetical protein